MRRETDKLGDLNFGARLRAVGLWGLTRGWTAEAEKGCEKDGCGVIAWKGWQGWRKRLGGGGEREELR